MMNIVSAVLVFLFMFVFAWSVYNLPILAAGVKCVIRKRLTSSRLKSTQLPVFSIIVPAKNEEKVIGRFLDAVARMNYPRDKLEVIVVGDGSTDSTISICKKHEAQNVNVTVVHKSVCNGKPSALNHGLRQAKGEIVAFFDADSVPAPDALLNVSKYFEDPKVAAVQGRNLSINPNQNMLTRFISYEEAIWCEVYLQGKDALDLFVHLKGSCQFLRRNVLEQLKGFDENALSEDMEISARLTEKGYKIRYASDTRSWQESPADLKQLLRQRTRWFRGTVEVALRYGRLMAKPTKRNIDAEATLIGPFVLILSLLSYVASFTSFFASVSFGVLWDFLLQMPVLTATLTLFLCGLALIWTSKPRKATSVLWLPFIYFYWTFQSLVASYAVGLILLRRPRKWIKTDKSGEVENQQLVLKSENVGKCCGVIVE
jgi:cellulose synthase/poly-beta-1,6-N-acetylglucosamine synthase-like glycosyltransferase